ncbi:hypothetical protein VTL71DRAFT_10227 [Oculimacula yallundae]|uniref:Yeast cell wall synthesis Kre9/Knh1-like N-terminal domain-containing protein n=1 Tax=Oculimacula yallundae TaxID=86028 RepID=A0ABR4BPM2_9HELO
MWLVPAISLFYLVEITAAAFTNPDFQNAQIGKPFTVTWSSPPPPPISLKLLEHKVLHRPDRTQIAVVGTIANTVSGDPGSYVWTQGEDLKENVTYVVQLLGAGGQEQLSENFKLLGKAVLPVSTTSMASTSPTSSAINLLASNPTQTPTPSLGSHLPKPKTQPNLNVRIAISLTIITILILIVVALIFYERGKRAALQKFDLGSSFGSSFTDRERGDGSDGLQLVEGCQIDGSGRMVADCTTCGSGIVVGHGESGGDVGEDGQVKVLNEEEEAKKRKMKSMSSIYELG